MTQQCNEITGLIHPFNLIGSVPQGIAGGMPNATFTALDIFGFAEVVAVYHIATQAHARC